MALALGLAPLLRLELRLWLPVLLLEAVEVGSSPVARALLLPCPCPCPPLLLLLLRLQLALRLLLLLPLPLPLLL